MRTGGGKTMKTGGALTVSCALSVLVSDLCPSSQNFDDTGHALFIDNNCYRASKGHTAKPETWREHSEELRSQMQNGKDGTQQLLRSSSGPCKECPIVPQDSRWPKPSSSIPEVQLSSKAGDTSGLYVTFCHHLTNCHIYQLNPWPLNPVTSR